MTKEKDNPSIYLGDDDMLTTDEAHAKAISYLATAKELKQLTRLNEREIKLLTKIITVAMIVKSETILAFAENFMQLRISTSGLGRQDILQIAQSAYEDKREGSRLRKMIGLGGRI